MVKYMNVVGKYALEELEHREEFFSGLINPEPIPKPCPPPEESPAIQF